MIASLGMYDMPYLQTANDRFWTAIRSELGYGPTSLTRTDDLWPIWQSPDLLFAQTCGYPFRACLSEHVQLVGTPDYGLPGCPPGYYCSVVVANREDPRSQLSEFDGAHFAYNEALSQSGWAAPVLMLSDQQLRPGKLTKTGSHAASARAVAAGTADFAALDQLTFLLIGTEDPDVVGALKPLCHTQPTPALPFITAKGRDAVEISAAIRRAISKLDDVTRQDLRLKGLIDISARDYLVVPTPPAPETFVTP